MIPSKQIREKIEELLERRDWHKAHLQLGDLWRQEGKASTAGYILSCYDRMLGELPAAKCRVSFLRSMTLEPVIPILRCAARVSGIDLATQIAPFNAYAQEILDPNSSLYSFDPGIVILAIQARDILPEIWESYLDLSPAEINSALERVRENLSTWIRTFRLRSDAALIVHSFEKPDAGAGILDAQGNDGQMAAIDRLNAELRAICREHRGVYVLDYDSLISRQGRTRWHDDAKWLTMRMPFAVESLLPMASEWMKFIHPLTGTICKAVAVDLDNTLWGGVLGEDGLSNLSVGPEYPGAFFRSLQRVLLDFYHRGILLVVCSKNDHNEAMAALENLPGMVLKPEHFAALRINWKDKADNLREIAAELNIGTDAIAFVDDNPVERERVRNALPEVKVLELPDQPQSFAAALRDCPLLERLSLSAEDREHMHHYRAQQARAQLAEAAGSLQDFYISLEQQISIAPASSETIGRIAQLTQKTNQFNVTTRRYNEQQLERYASQPGWKIYSVRVKDRFGDNGIVGAVITSTNGDICEIDTFLLSCRVIGRTIETAVLGYLAEACRAEGARFLQGWFIPTAKNAPVRELYSTHRFAPIAINGNATLWRLNLAEAEIAQPEWIRLHVGNEIWRVEQARA